MEYQMDNRDAEEQFERRSRASSPSGFSSISSTAKSSSNNGSRNQPPQQQFVIIAANPGSNPTELFDDSRVNNLAKATNFAELSKLRDSLSGSNSAINIVYMPQQDKDTPSKGSPMSHHRRTSDRRGTGGGITIAEATSWDPQTPGQDRERERLEALTADDMSSAADLYGIRLKMEEKRKRIEAEKRQMELMATQQRAKVGKAAFLQVNIFYGHWHSACKQTNRLEVD